MEQKFPQDDILPPSYEEVMYSGPPVDKIVPSAPTLQSYTKIPKTDVIYNHAKSPPFFSCQVRYPNDQPKTEDIYRNGKLEESKEWYENGTLKSQEFYRDGKLEGKHEGWHENGKIKYLSYYKSGKPEGKREIWYTNGQPRLSEFYLNGKLEGNRFEWHKNGTLERSEHYVEGKLDGICESWDENRNRTCRESYRMGVLLESKRLLDNGETEIIKTLGKFCCFNDDTRKREIYDKNGTRKLEEHYFAGKLDGRRRVWNDTGKLIISEFYDEGNLK